jgi:two-component system, OmpR family, phosphate regulon sensor histidine kinase PhoR
LGLFTTVYVRGTLRGMIEDPSLAAGAWLTTEAPGEEPAGESIFTEVPVGAALPGWRLAVAIDSKTDFDSIAAPRVNTLIWVACTVIAGMTVLTIIIARSFGRQTRLARLKNDLVANVSHELKTPLTAMRALVETLIDSERLDEKTTREYLQMIATENMRLSRLIENFLTFSRLERDRYAFDFKVVRPEAVVDAAVVAFGERGHAPGCTLDLGVERDLPMIRGDVDALTTAVLNLMENAWKYSGDEKRIRVGASAHNGSVTFAVADNGIGLSARESRRVFGRFYQSDQRLARTAGGCGLGLSIVQSIVATHHGVVRVESELGKGSTFSIEIPTSGGATG